MGDFCMYLWKHVVGNPGQTLLYDIQQYHHTRPLEKIVLVIKISYNATHDTETYIYI